MPYAVANRVRLYYEVHGEGEPLVLIMGTGNDHSVWASQVAAHSPHFRCVVFDNRGVGRSDVPPPGYSMADLAADTLGLMDCLHIEAAHISGFSMGGSIGIAMAIAAPNRILSLSLHSTSGRLYPSITHRYRVLIPVTRSGDADLWAETTVITAFRDTYINANPEAVEREVVRRRELRARMTPEQVEGLIGHYVAFSTYDPWDRLGEIQSPTLISVGTDDAVTPPDYARDLHNRIRGSVLHEIENAPHRTVTFAANELNRISLEFLLEQTGRKR